MDPLKKFFRSMNSSGVDRSKKFFQPMIPLKMVPSKINQQINRLSKKWFHIPSMVVFSATFTQTNTLEGLDKKISRVSIESSQGQSFERKWPIKQSPNVFKNKQAWCFCHLSSNWYVFYYSSNNWYVFCHKFDNWYVFFCQRSKMMSLLEWTNQRTQ